MPDTLTLPTYVPTLPSALQLNSTATVIFNQEETIAAVNHATQRDQGSLQLITISGLCGGCKSTLSRELGSTLSHRAQTSTFNGIDSPVLALDNLISTSRGPQRGRLLSSSDPDNIRTRFFRIDEIKRLIDSLLNGNRFDMNDAYDPGNSGQLTGSLSLHRDPANEPLLIAEGAVAQAAVQIALSKTADEAVMRTVATVDLLIFTDPAIAVLNAVKRGVEKPNRRKDPIAAFKEYLAFNSLLLPGYLKYDQHSADLIYEPTDLHPIMFKALVEFFSLNENQNLLPTFIRIVEEEFTNDDPIPKRINEHMVTMLKAIQEALESPACAVQHLNPEPPTAH